MMDIVPGVFQEFIRSQIYALNWAESKLSLQKQHGDVLGLGLTLVIQAIRAQSFSRFKRIFKCFL